jgi:hypothetical protein
LISSSVTAGRSRSSRAVERPYQLERRPCASVTTIRSAESESLGREDRVGWTPLVDDGPHVGDIRSHPLRELLDTSAQVC